VPLLEEDERYLDEKGYDWEVVTDGSNEFLMLKGVSLDAVTFDHSTADVLILIPGQYNTAPLDMWFLEPWVRLRSGGNPAQADVPVQMLGRTWQRFSRHLPIWRPGVDNLTTLLVFMSRELCPPAALTTQAA
jgi:hypothetical protein